MAPLHKASPSRTSSSCESSSCSNDERFGPHSTLILLKEIAGLRTKLRELEEDSKSSVVGTASDAGGSDAAEVSTMLRAQLAKVEHEKAQLEKEFMNQLNKLAVDNQKNLGSLESKLRQSQLQNSTLTEQVQAKSTNEQVELLKRRLESERATHQRELDDLRKNNAESNDSTSSDNNNMQAKIRDLQHHNDELLEEVILVRRDLEAEVECKEAFQRQVDECKRTITQLGQELATKDASLSRKHEEMGEMNDALIELEQHKEMLVQENMELRLQLQAERTGKSSSPAPSIESIPALSAISTNEREQLEEAVSQLEERLSNFHIKLTEKDEALESMAVSLHEERKLNKGLKSELKRLKCSTPGRSSSSIALSPKFERSPVSRTRSLDATSPLLEEAATAAASPLSSLSSPTTASSFTANRPPPLKYPDEGGGGATTKSSPRISGMVGLWEQRILKKSNVLSPPSEDRSKELEQELEGERQLNKELRAQLQQEQRIVFDLRLQVAEIPSSEERQSKLDEAQEECRRLMALVDDYEDSHTKLEDELGQLATEKENLEARLWECDQEIERLRMDAHMMHQDEKKDDDESANKEELTRLHAQISSLQCELESTMAQVERLQAESTNLNEALGLERLAKSDAIKQAKVLTEEKVQMRKDLQTNAIDRSDLNSEINKLQVELANAAMAKKQAHTNFEARIAELEQDVEALEVEGDEALEAKNREMDELRARLVEKEEAIARMEAEHTQFCSTVNSASESRKDEIEELQSELMDVTNKATAQAREIQALKLKIDEHENRKSQAEERLHNRIHELQEQVAGAKEAGRRAGTGAVDKLQEDNYRLKDALRELKLERRTLQDRVDSMTSERGSGSKSVQVLRDRNTALKDEVEKLTKRLRKMESSITRFAI